MKINAHPGLLPEEIRVNARVIFCELCDGELSDMLFQYEFTDGTELVAQVCNRCCVDAATDDDLACLLLDKELQEIEMAISGVKSEIEFYRSLL